MDVQGEQAGTHRSDVTSRSASPSRSHALSTEQVGAALGAWRASELRLARSFGECRRLGHAQLEDLYQETAIVLLARSYHDEEHLRNALRVGIKHRALNLRRDDRRRGEILEQRTPELALTLQVRQDERGPELAAILAQDGLLVTEFMAELSAFEQSVFRLMADGMGYRAIAPALETPVNETRRAFRSCETKRERFQLLYDTGRLCGFRSHTIRALQAGERTSAELARRAYAHLDACASCRAEHKTNSRRLRRSFQAEVAALLPLPVLSGRLGWVARLGQRVRDLHQRVLPYGSAPTTGGVRERAIAMLASGGAAAKVAAGAATVAVLAGGTIGATHALHSGQSGHPHRHKETVTGSSAPAPTAARTAAAPSSAETAAGASSEPTRSATKPSSSHPHEPGGFAFLGVPGRSGGAPQVSTRATSASDRVHARPASESRGETKLAGGAFSP